jgi:hypothetical protein
MPVGAAGLVESIRAARYGQHQDDAGPPLDARGLEGQAKAARPTRASTSACAIRWDG